MESGESIFSVTIAGVVTWRLARSMGFGLPVRLLIRLPVRVPDRLCDVFSSTLSWEAGHLSGLTGRVLDAVACISVLLSPNVLLYVSLYVLAASAGVILMGLFTATTRRSQQRNAAGPVAARAGLGSAQSEALRRIGSGSERNL
jgi:hypothetical protein